MGGSRATEELASLLALTRIFALSASGSADHEDLGRHTGVLRATTPATWDRLLPLLHHNRITGLVGAALVATDSLGELPDRIATTFSEVSQAAIEFNRARLARFFEVLHQLRDGDVEPVLLKSAAMAAQHPDLLLHNEMSDVDLYIPADQLDRFSEIVIHSGFQRSEESGDAVYFEHESGGAKLDVHYRFRLFEHTDFTELTTRQPLRVAEGETAILLSSEAGLVHLVHHLNHHRPPHGYHLHWLFDLLTLLLREGPRMSPQKLAAAAPDDHWSFWLARLIGFFTDELEADLADLPIAPAPIAGFCLEEVLTSQRHASFPLDSIRGWKALAGAGLGLREKGRRVFPRPADAAAMRRFSVAEELAEREFRAS